MSPNCKGSLHSLLLLLLNKKHWALRTRSTGFSEVFQSLRNSALWELLSPGLIQVNFSEKADLWKSTEAGSYWLYAVIHMEDIVYVCVSWVYFVFDVWGSFLQIRVKNTAHWISRCKWAKPSLWCCLHCLQLISLNCEFRDCT